MKPTSTPDTAHERAQSTADTVQRAHFELYSVAARAESRGHYMLAARLYELAARATSVYQHAARYEADADRCRVRIHERLNRVSYYPAQAERVAREWQSTGKPIKTQSGYELAAYAMPNGSRFVTLSDDTEQTWENYASEQTGKAVQP